MLSKLMDVEQVENKSMVLIGIFPAGSQSRPTRFGSLRTTTYSYATVGLELSKLEARDLNILPPNEQWN